MRLSTADREARCREQLVASDLCAALDAAAIEALLQRAQLRHYLAGDWILHQGEAADALFLPCDGQQMIERTGGTGNRQVLGFLQAGDLLGLGSTTDWIYSVQCLTETCAIRLPADGLSRLGHDHPRLRENLASISLQILTRMMDHLYAIGQKRSQEKLAFLLWQRFTRQPDTESALLALPMRRVDIGDYLGLTLETTSRAFTALRKAGVIADAGPNMVHVTNPKKLEELARVA